jgi:hypothetical protein
MKIAAQAVSALALVATIVPPLLLLAGRLELEPMKTWMLAATVAWFVATPFWMEHKSGG